MPRSSRIVISGCPHHVTQRGNRGGDVFFSVEDRLRYLELLAIYATKHRLSVQAYCLMTNHVHLVIVPQDETSLAAGLKPLHTRYTQHVNRALGVTGRLWQGRFFSCPLDRKHLWAAVKYVELNPVRAGMVEKAEAYRFSSAAAHGGMRADKLLSDPCKMTRDLTPKQWLRWLSQESDEQAEFAANIQRCTHTGRPAGGKRFINHLEKRTGKSLRSNPPGRPKNKKNATKNK